MDNDASLLSKVVANIRFIHQKIASLRKEILALKAEQRIITRNLEELKVRLDRLDNGQ